MAKHAPKTIAEVQQQFSPGGSSAFDRIMANAKELFPQPIALAAPDEPWHGELDRLMAAAPDLSPDAPVSARVELLRARQTQLQGWLTDRTSIFRNRGLESRMVGCETVEFECLSCGCSWLRLAGKPPTDAELLCPNGCNRGLG
jgi:hypothetical protein